MYNSHFGFRDFPFRIASDPSGFYFNRRIQTTYTKLLQGIYSDVPLLVLTGQTGTGKTALVRKISVDLGRQYQAIFSRRRYSGFEELVEDFCRQLNLDCSEKTLLQNVHLLSNHLIEERGKGRHILFVLDATEDFSPDAIVNLILLTGIPKSSGSLFQVLLIGLPAMEQAFEETHLAQFKNDTNCWLRLVNLGTKEVGDYVEFRIRSVGCRKDNPFSPDAISRIAYYSGGNPGIINRFCSFALLGTFLDERTTVSADIIDEVAAQCILNRVPPYTPHDRAAGLRGARPERPGVAVPQQTNGGFDRKAGPSFPTMPEYDPDRLSTRYRELGIPKPETALAPVLSTVSDEANGYRKLLHFFADKIRPGNILFFSVIASLVIGAVYIYAERGSELFWTSPRDSSQIKAAVREISLSVPAENGGNRLAGREKIDPQSDQLQSDEPGPDEEANRDSLTEMNPEARFSQLPDVSSQRLQTALRLAELQIQQKRLTSPPGDNAFATYKSLLTDYPGNKDALYGIFKIKRLYQRWGLDAERRGDLLGAREYYSRALRVAPHDVVVSTALQHVTKKLYVRLKYDS